LFSVLVLGLNLTHLLLEHDDLLDGGLFVVLFGGFEVGALFWRRGFEQGIGMGHGDGVAGDHQLHRLHLPCGLHVAQHPRHIRRELFVLQPGDGIRANTLKQVDAPVDGAQVHTKGAGQALFADAPVNGAADHVVLLNGREPVDPMVVGVGFIVLGDQAGGLMDAQVLQCQHPQMAVEQYEFRLGRIVLDHRQRLDQADFMD